MYLRVEDKLSKIPKEECQIEECEHPNSQVPRNVSLQTGASEKVVLIDPVVSEEPKQDHEGANRDEISV